MKKILLKISLSSLALMSAFSLTAQCSFTLTASDTSICLGDTVNLTATPATTMLTTTFAAGNNHRGNMFDIVAINEITITSFDAHPMGNTDYEIYYKVGGFAGSENTPGNWTLVGGATGVIAQPLGTPTPLPIPVNITIPAGQTYAFYVTSTNVAVAQNYTNGSAQGAVFASDANLQFLEGVGLEYPFSGAPFSPRVWNGNIHYYLGGTAPLSPSYLWSTGDTTASITVSPANTTQYNVSVDINGCSTLIDSLEIDVVGSMVNLGADVNLCPGDSVILDAGSAGASFMWSDATTNQTLSVNMTASVYVDMVDTFGCTSSDTVDVIMNPNPVVNLGADTSICENSSLVLNGGTFSTYSWSTGDTTMTSTVGNMSLPVGSNNISLNVIDINGCTGGDTISILVNALPTIDLGADTVICVNGSVTLDAGSGFTTYLWYDSSTSQTLLLDGATIGAGTETVTVTVSNTDGCSNTDTLFLTVDPCTGIIGYNQLNFSLYPNPTRDALNLVFDNASNGRITIATMEGRLVQEVSLNGDLRKTIDVSGLAPGIYSLTVVDGTFIGTKQVMIK